MNSALRITARVDEVTQELLKKASAIMGVSSINAFVVSSAVEKAKNIIEQEEFLRLSKKDTELFLSALDEEPIANSNLREAFLEHSKRVES